MKKGWKARLFRLLGFLWLFGQWHDRNGVIVGIGLVTVVFGRLLQCYFIFDEDNSAMEHSDAGEELMVYGLAFVLYGLLSWAFPYLARLF